MARRLAAQLESWTSRFALLFYERFYFPSGEASGLAASCGNRESVLKSGRWR
jgi:hypothetical protein